MLKLFMYGSCVSRDTYDFFDRAQCQLLGYVSRQSIISAFHPADPAVLERSTMTSPFQLKNSQGDFRGDLFSRLEAEGRDADVIVWDLIDERNGVVRTADGGYVTFTYDLHRANVFALMEEDRSFLGRLGFGSNEHFELWCRSVDRFMAELDTRGVKGKLLLLVAPWALETDTQEEPTHWSLGPSPAEANALFERYYEYLRRVHEVSTLEASAESVVTRKDHKWGPAPYHYIDAPYLAWKAGIDDFAAEL